MLNKELPDLCYSVLEITGEIILIKKGEDGYHTLDYKEQRTADELNKILGVSKSQEK